MRSFHAIVFGSIQLAFLLAVLIHPAERNLALAAGLPDYLNNAKEFMINMVKDRVISKTNIVGTFKETLDIVKQRYDQEKVNLAPGDDGSVLYYKITVEEIQNLRRRLEDERAKKMADQADVKDVDDMFDDVDSKLDRDLTVINNSNVPSDMDLESELDSETEKELMNQLGDLEDEEKKEVDMGWSMKAEQREQLRMRTKNVLTDLMKNEIKLLVMTVIACYSTGRPVGAVGAVFGISIKFKIVQYLVTIVSDFFSNLMGRRVEIETNTAPQPNRVPQAA